MKKITKKEQMSINGGTHYHWQCYAGTHNHYSVARTKFSAIKWRDRHNSLYHSGAKKATLDDPCNRSCGKVYENIP